MNNNNKITFLDLVFPLFFIYSSGLFFWAYFIKTNDYTNPILDVFVIFVTSTFFCYGVLSFVRDLKHGFRYILRNFRKIK
jgi:hypothetical protein